MSKVLTDEEIAIRALEIEKKIGEKVRPIAFINPEDPEDQVLGFLKYPSRFVKLRAMDKAVMSPSSAGAELLEAVLVTEDSDPRILSDDRFYFGGVTAAMQLVEVAQDTFKKK